MRYSKAFAEKISSNMLPPIFYIFGAVSDINKNDNKHHPQYFRTHRKQTNSDEIDKKNYVHLGTWR